MSRRSAGILLYRRASASLEVFLVHPGGPYWARKDIGAWSIPKGEYHETEPGIDAALREFEEETGHSVNGPFIDLGSVRLKGGKVVSAWAAEGTIDPDLIESNEFPLEWPPKSGEIRYFPEVDQAGWFGLDVAGQKINSGQRPFIERLLERIAQ